MKEKNHEHINQITKKYLYRNNIRGREVDSYLPFYDEYADFNTNAKSYYDYLARYNHTIRLYADLINRLLRRNIEVFETDSTKFIKNNDWIDNGKCPPDNFDDIIEFLVHVKKSLETEKYIFKTYIEKQEVNKQFIMDNSLNIYKDGLYTPDYSPVLDFIGQRLADHEKWLEDHEEWLEDHEKWLEDHEDWLSRLQVQVNDNTMNINMIRGINLTELKKGVDYELEFFNGFYAPADDLVVKVGETSTTLDLSITSHSTSGRVLKHDGDLRTQTEMSLRPDATYPAKSRVFAIKLLGKYADYQTKPIVLDNTISTLWHLRPMSARASWEVLLTPHKKNNAVEFNWRQMSDGYGTQLETAYAEVEDNLKLEWGNIDCRVTLEKGKK